MKFDTSEHPVALKTPEVSLTDLQRRMIFSPLRLVLTLAAVIFFIELCAMFLIESFFDLTALQESLLDSTLLTILLIPVLLVCLYRPLINLVNDCRQTEVELKTNQDLLEQKVTERTRELEAAIDRIKKENEESLRAKMALSESEERFRQLFTQSEDAIILLALEDGTIIDVNPTAERIFRIKRTDLLKDDLPSLCARMEPSDLKTILEKILHNGTSTRIDRFECTIAPGDVRIISSRWKTITLQGAKVAYATFRDITTRTRLEEEALEIQARLIQANRMTSLGTMVSSVAHEINNPNNFLLMNANIIKQSWYDIAPIIEEHVQAQGDFPVARSTWSEARLFLPEAIEGMQQGALRISSIVENLKEFGRDDRFNPDSLADVNAVVQLSASILNGQISRATHRFQLKLAENLPQVRGSARQLEQVVINLIQNGLQSLPDPDHGVRVTTGMDPDSGQVMIQVEDEGHGIPPEITNRILEPFFTTRLEQGGTGLGLAISTTIVKEHGGSIDFSSVSGKGTTFTVKLCQERRQGSSGETP